jgi:micrococcal nuclease
MYNNNKIFICKLSMNLLTLLMLVFSSFSIISLSIEPDVAFARCPNGYHISPSGNCEKVVDLSERLSRCPDGYHRSPDGDCEKVTGSSSSSSADNSNNGKHIDLESSNDERIYNNNTDGNNGANVLSSTECQGQADCFKGKVTAIVDGDTLDINNNIRVRLTLVNTPERGAAGYTEAKEFVNSVCSIGTDVLVDEDDGQKEGSYDRLIGLIYCSGGDDDAAVDNKRRVLLLNEVLLQRGYAVIFEEYCDRSEFSKAAWAQVYGC